MRQIRETAQENYGEKYNYNLIPQTMISLAMKNFTLVTLYFLICYVLFLMERLAMYSTFTSFKFDTRKVSTCLHSSSTRISFSQRGDRMTKVKHREQHSLSLSLASMSVPEGTGQYLETNDVSGRKNIQIILPVAKSH